MSGSDRPELSVVIASVNGLPYPLACLEALTHQEAAAPEVILADCTGPSTVAAVRERFPDVRVLAFDEPKSVPWLRAAGIREATGRLVAITEDHCIPTPDWCHRLVEAQEATGWAAVGGGVRNGSRDRLIDWVVFFCEYSQHMDPVDDGPSSVLPGMNVAYDMDALADMKAMFEEGLWESFLHERLVDAGHVLGLSSGVVVDHQKYFTPAMFASERFHYSRSFAGMRVEGRGVGTRLAWATASLALPPLLVARITSRVLAKRQYAGWYAKAFPLVVAFSVIWAAGECWGYLTGPGDSLLKVR